MLLRQKIGLVNKVVPHKDLVNVTLELADKIASKAPLAVQLTMEGVRRGLNWNMGEFMQYHARAFTFCMETEDPQEGARAFVEKREPVFKGNSEEPKIIKVVGRIDEGKNYLNYLELNILQC
jgi:enoyl-CoA hydratase